MSVSNKGIGTIPTEEANMQRPHDTQMARSTL